MTTLNKDFKDFGLPSHLLEGLTKLGFTAPTPIQAQSIPAALGGKDVLAIAPTGTGKTGAFGIPAIANLTSQKEKQVLVLAPTRELAAQIFKFLSSVVPTSSVRGALLVGGESSRRQYLDWNAGVDFIVATPGRLMDHVGRGLNLKHVGILILDEVDRMLDMGFAPQIEEILKMVPEERQTLFFSATLPLEIQKLIAKFLKDPVRITVGGNKEHAPKIREEKVHAKGYEKIDLLKKVIGEHTGKILIFTRTKVFTDRVAEQLEFMDIRAARLHGGRTQEERTRALDAFRRGVVRVLVATDIAARGIDVADIEVVVNFDKAATKEDYTHRIGRTGRCGKEGLAITFLDDFRGGGEERRGRGAAGGGRRFFRGNRGRNDSEGRAPTRFSAPRSHPPEDIHAQAMADSDPKNFGRKAFPRYKSKPNYDRPFKKREVSEGVSGSVRYFRNKDSKPGFVKRNHVSVPKETKPMKPSPGLARGKKGAVRRPHASQ